jgi:hypothetical protein
MNSHTKGGKRCQRTHVGEVRSPRLLSAAVATALIGRQLSAS